MNIENFSVVKAARKYSKAKTYKGLVRFLEKHPISIAGANPMQLDNVMLANSKLISDNLKRAVSLSRRIVTFRLYNPVLAAQGKNLVKKNGRWRISGGYTNDPEKHLTEYIYRIGSGRYPKYSYEGLYHSVVATTDSGKIAWVLAEGKLARTIKAPRGLRWDYDENGVCLVAKDGTNYHPDYKDYNSPDFVARVRKALTAKRLIVKEEKRREKLEKTNLKVWSQSRVTLLDSQNAGNCEVGTIAFAMRQGLSREQVKAPYFFIPAQKLIDSNNRDALRAVRFAYDRETLVTI